MLLSGTVYAHKYVIIIPIWDSSETPAGGTGSLQQIVVAKSGGDYTDIQKAVDYASRQATPSRPWTVFIAPGIYTIDKPLFLKSNIHLIGSGKFATVLKASIYSSIDNYTSSLVYSDTEVGETQPGNIVISHLALRNISSNGKYVTGIHFRNRSLRVDDVDVHVESSHPDSRASGIFSDSSNGLITNLRIKSLGVVSGYGIWNNNPCLGALFLGGHVHSVYLNFSSSGLILLF